LINGIITYHLPVQEEEPPLPPEDEQSDDGQTAKSEPVDHLTPRERYLLRKARKEAERRE
jgi:hypothetical protein